MAGSVYRHGQGVGRRLRLGVTNLLASRQKTDQPMGCRSYLLFSRSKSHSCFGHVRTFLSHRLWSQGSGIRRCLHEQHQLGKCLAPAPQTCTKVITLRRKRHVEVLEDICWLIVSVSDDVTATRT